MFGHDFRAQRDPINNVTIYVPAIVDRNAAKSLATVIEGEKEYVSMPRPPFCLVVPRLHSRWTYGQRIKNSFSPLTRGRTNF